MEFTAIQGLVSLAVFVPMFDLIETIIRVMCWPYQIWKHSIENSRIGASPADHDTLRFWKRFAIYGSLIVLVLAGIVFVVVVM